MDRGAWQATIHEVTKSQTCLSDFHFTISAFSLPVMYFFGISLFFFFFLLFLGFIQIDSVTFILIILVTSADN